MNHPTLYLRPVGFDAQACAALEQQLESCVTAGFQWEITLHPETDVSLVLGDKCTLDYEGTPHAELVVTLPNGGFESILLEQIGSPILLQLPASEVLQAQTCFIPVDHHNTSQFKKALSTVAHALRYERVLYALGACLFQQNLLTTEDDGAGRRNLHVQDEQHQLIALINLGHRQIYFSPQTDPSQVQDWQVYKRPSSANEYPEHFVQVTLEEALWEYAMRTPTPDLPSRYLHAGISLARRPQVRPSLLRLRHASLFDRLNQDTPVLAEDLSRHNGTYAEYLKRDLFALHICGCLNSQSNASPSSIPAWVGNLRTLIRGGQSKRSPSGKQKNKEAQDSLT